MKLWEIITREKPSKNDCVTMGGAKNAREKDGKKKLIISSTIHPTNLCPTSHPQSGIREPHCSGGILCGLMVVSRRIASRGRALIPQHYAAGGVKKKHVVAQTLPICILFGSILVASHLNVLRKHCHSDISTCGAYIRTGRYMAIFGNWVVLLGGVGVE